MKIKLDINELPDELYNQLLMAFVSKAIIEGIDVPRGAKVEEWNLTADCVGSVSPIGFVSKDNTSNAFLT